MVGRFIKDEHVGGIQQYKSQGHTFSLSARKGSNRLVKIVDVKLSEDLLHALFVIPGVGSIHPGGCLLKSLLCFFVEIFGLSLSGALICPDQLHHFIVALGYIVADSEVLIELRVLFEETDADIILDHYFAFIRCFFAGQNMKERRFSRAVFGNKCCFVSFGNAKRKSLK